MQQLPTFPHFENPLAENVFEQSLTPCACCDKPRGWIYTGPVYASRDDLDSRICPWCIADGSAATKLDCTFNDGILDSDEGDAEPEDVDVIQRQTPGHGSWQGVYWRTCCGKPCVYVGEADAEDLAEGGRWEAAAASLIEWNASELEWPESDSRELIESISKRSSPAAYVFRCQRCSGLKAYWDCD